MMDAHVVLPVFNGTTKAMTQVIDVNYTASGVDYLGRLYYNGAVTEARPMVVIYPDWDGASEYEFWRASMLTQWGYLAFVADVYGADVPVGDALAIEVGCQEARRLLSDI